MKVFGKDASVIRARPGESFLLELEALPGAGYRWRVTGDPDGVGLQELPPQPGPGIGAAARQRFQGDALKPGTFRLTLEFGRPWEQNPQERRTIEVIVE